MSERALNHQNKIDFYLLWTYLADTKYRINFFFLSKQIQKTNLCMLLCKPNWKLNTSDNRISRVLWFSFTIVFFFDLSSACLLLCFFFIIPGKKYRNIRVFFARLSLCFFLFFQFVKFILKTCLDIHAEKKTIQYLYELNC